MPKKVVTYKKIRNPKKMPKKRAPVFPPFAHRTRTLRSIGQTVKARRFAKNIRYSKKRSDTADNTFLLTYTDRVRNPADAKDSPALHAYWASNSTTSGGQPQPGNTENLSVYDPQYLQLISTSINANKTVRFTVKSWETSARVTNLMTAPVTFWEYRLMSRYDQPTIAATLLGAATDAGIVAGGFADASATGIGTTPVTVQQMGATPFMNPLLTTNFKIIKVRRWEIKPGGHKIIKYSKRQDKVFSAEHFAPAGTIKAFIKGETFSLFVAEGTLATSSASTANWQVGVSSVDIGIQFQVKIHYTWVSDVTNATGYYNNTPGFVYGVPAIPAPVVLNYPVPQPQLPTAGYVAAPYVVEAYEEK